MTAPSRPRTPGLVAGIVSLVGLVLLAVVALTARQPAPPSIAEVAPQAVSQIKKAPDDQSSQFGNAPGGKAVASGRPTPTPTADRAPSPTPTKEIKIPLVKRCVGSPPRQIEDPQSPPCVNYWEGKNGGATSFGVTADQITVAVPNWDDTIHPALERFFNDRFQFYGRHLKLVKLGSSNSSSDPAAQRADAIAAKNIKAFASLDYSGGNIYYYQQLAQLKIISASSQPIFDNTSLERAAPYQWQYPMPVDDMYANVGSWVCARLAGQRATKAGGPKPGTTAMRKFGIIQQVYSSDYKLPLKPLNDQLKACGITRPPTVSYVYDLDPAKANSAVVTMANADVTSIICLCQALSMGHMGRAATGQGYFPEWLINSYLLSDLNGLIGQFMPTEQRVHMLGLTFLPKQINSASNPAGYALREGGGPPRSNSAEVTPLNIEYRTLLLLASGIQMAGPKLTPERFARALHTTAFPNPSTPLYAGRVGFAEGSAGMTDDAAEIWWGEGQQGPYSDSTSAFCYVDRGRRHVLGSYPKGGNPFQGPCDTGANG